MYSLEYQKLNQHLLDKLFKNLDIEAVIEELERVAAFNLSSTIRDHNTSSIRPPQDEEGTQG